jgi:hypothetical protein
VKVTRTSLLTGVTRTIDLPATEAQYAAWLSGGQLIQDAFPGLSADEREFIKTGMTPDEWARIFGPDDTLTDAAGTDLPVEAA